jgi:hypothetical protein
MKGQAHMHGISPRPDRPWEDADHGAPAVKKRGLSTGAKVALALGISLGGLVLLCVAGLALFVVYGDQMMYGKEIKLNSGSQLFYTSAVTEAEARKLADYLNEDSSNNSNRVSYQLNKNGTVYQVRMVVKDGMSQNELYAAVAAVWGQKISEQVFERAPVEVHLCDTSFKTLRVVPASQPGTKS